MRKFPALYTLIVTMLIGLMTPALSRAEEQSGEAKEHKKGPNKEMLKKYDTNKDGVISEEEEIAMKAAREAEKAEMLKKYDADGNGELSKEEKMKMREDRKKEWADKKKEKANKDGGKEAEGEQE